MTHSAADDLVDDLVDDLRAQLPAARLDGCGLSRLPLGEQVVSGLADVVGALCAHRATGVAERPVVALLGDVTPIRYGELDLKDHVEGLLRERFEVRRAVLDDGTPTLHVSEPVVAQAVSVTRGADAVVAVGGGTVSDIGKLAARGTDGGPGPVLVTVQTAASVDGFTNDMSVLLRDGVKRTVPSRWADAVLADAQVIAGAPAPMNRAGYGEMTSMLVAPVDWRLAQLVGTDDTYDDEVLAPLRTLGTQVGTWAAGVRTGDPACVAELVRTLAVRGVVGGIAGTTAPLSGLEHLVSHMLDLHHAARHEPTGLHGAQVGVAGVVAAAAWELLAERMAGTVAGRRTARVDDALLQPVPARARVEAAFAHLDPTGAVVAECWRDYESKLAAVTAVRPRLDALLADWDATWAQLSPLVAGSHELAAGLRAAGSAATFDELDPAVPPELAHWALANAGLMRRRFTIADLLTLLGWWTDADVAEVLDRAGAAVEGADLVTAHGAGSRVR